MYWIVLLIIAYVLNLYFTFLQMEKYKKGGSVTILVISKDEFIKYGEQMKGRTVFANFKPIEGIIGMAVNDVEKVENEESIIQAVSFYKEYMSSNKKSI